MRSATGTKSGPPSLVTRVTKSMIPRLAAPSFQDGSGSARPVCARCEAPGCAAPNPSATASITIDIAHRMTRRLLFIEISPYEHHLLIPYTRLKTDLEKEQDRRLDAERAARRNTDPICSPTTELRGDPEARRNPVVEIGEAHIVKRALAGRQIAVKGVVPAVGGVDLPFVVDVVGQLRPCAGGSNRH